MPTTQPPEIILADGKPANGEQFHIWPDPTGRLGDSRLWPHFIDFLCHRGYPADWELGLASLNESQLLRAFDVRALYFHPPEVHVQWTAALALVRIRLQALNPNAAIAFCLHPNNDQAALVQMRKLGNTPVSLDILTLPN